MIEPSRRALLQVRLRCRFRLSGGGCTQANLLLLRT